MAKQNAAPIHPFNALDQIHLNAAGIDIGAEEVYVAVPPDRDTQSVRRFGTFTADFMALAEWLKQCHIETVAMEATGVYWIALYDILEAQGLEVYLVNARHLKNVRGRKTDVVDCQWIQQLHTYGLLNASFRPPAQITALRSLVRHREMLVEYRSAHIQHMQKELIQMNLRLTSVLSDITGVSGMRIIRAILAGERNPQVLSSLRDEHCQKSETEIAKALEGHYQPEHLFALKQAVELYDFYEHQMADCDAELERMYKSLDSAPHPPANGAPTQRKPKSRRKNQAHFDLTAALYRVTGLNLTDIDGVDALTIQKVISEIGTDMSPWPTEKHFAAWLHLCPNNQVTGGKVKRRRVQRTQNRVSTALRVAAVSLHHSESALGAFYRRIQARSGSPAAVTATAHKLARIIYAMLKNNTPYRDEGVATYEQRYRERIIRNLNRQAYRFGYHLEPATSVVMQRVS
jgi:transposase